MTRYTDEWLDAKLMNIQRWKAQEAARSAAKQSTAGAASPAGVPSTPVAAPAPDDVRWICEPCGALHCNGRRDEHIATWHIGRCDICADETAVTEPRDFGYLKATKADAATDRTLSDKSANGQRRTVPSLGGAAAASSGTKYRNKRTNGYASKREAKRASELKLMAEAGTIRNLREQVEFLLIPRQKRPNGTVAERSCSYFADFVYDEFRDGDWRPVVEDTKGFRTPDYIIKRKLVLFVHGIEIREV